MKKYEFIFLFLTQLKNVTNFTKDLQKNVDFFSICGIINNEVL